MQYGILGPFEVRFDGASVEVPRPRQRAGLALLLANTNRPVSIDRMVDALWGEAPPRTARAQVHKVVSALRQVLPPAGSRLLTFEAAGYRLAVDEADLDATAFAAALARARLLAADGHAGEAAQRLRSGLALWRGPALSGIDAPFAASARTRLEEERFAAYELLADLELDRGRHRELVPELTALLGEYPARESIAERVATALYRCGRQADALAVVRATGQVLADEYGLDLGDRLADLEQAILRHELPVPVAARSAVVADATGPGGSPQCPPPAQLPRVTYGFVGRREEIERLAALSAAGAGGTRIVALTGPAGVGKTSLALRSAQDLAADYPDGQLFVDLHGYDRDEGESLERVLERLLIALGVPGHRIPGDATLREDLYRSTVADRRLLVVLDNARDYEQVRPLLPGSARSFTVVTSRGVLSALVAGTGAFPMRLGMLSLADSVEVLGRIVGQDRVARAPEAADELARLCGGLPLALRISAVRLAEHPELPLSGLAAELACEDERLSGLSLPEDELTVSRALDHTYRRLGEGPARLLRLLGLHPAGVVAEASAAALLGLPGTPLGASAAPARPLLRALESVHLIEQSAPGGRYRVHDLVRLYGRQLADADPAESAAARARLFAWYLTVADAARRLLDPAGLHLPIEPRHPWSGPYPFEAVEGARDWFDRESGNLVALTRLAASLGDHDTVWRLAAVQHAYLLRSHRLGVLAETQRLGERAALLVGHGLAAATLADNLGIAYSNQRDHRAQECYQRALAGHLARGDRRRAAHTRLNLGSMHYEFGQPERAAGYLQQVIEAARELDDGRLLVKALANLVRTECDHATARWLLAEAVTRAEADGEGHLATIFRGQLAWVLHRMGDHREAFALSEQSLAEARRLGDPLVSARMLDQMGLARAGQGRSADARTYWEEAVETFVRIERNPEAEEVRGRLAACG
ncbi:DNA-binding SARP family transcriptional activator [Kitasatospora sp. GP30]|uniref:AfsR/SARP family transcriptional regulator n=1 Tax=Kitasatospora sp. GP30 TaxID=3035084 RepID=UPI000CB126CE|nr:BTAD domain-containing putative transcriptional regulator [Kitasatospora sp. GP30]MDH6143605.1 DNA-binding SARP family transcriptional activator [Kitasatospora sp. GP30]